LKKAVKLATVFAQVAQVWAVTALMLASAGFITVAMAITSMLASAGFITVAMAITSMLVSAVVCVYLEALGPHENFYRDLKR
jgi:Na+/H+-translocating membrane pyrophosphatase